jgi:hypothetical protein
LSGITVIVLLVQSLLARLTRRRKIKLLVG